MEERIFCIYHRDCIDGTAAAAVLLRKYPNAVFIPLAHRHTTEEMRSVLTAVTGTAHVYLLDASFMLAELLERDIKVTVVEHHMSEHEYITTLSHTWPNLQYIFNNERAAAILTWQHLFPEESVPELITYIEDIDLWNNAYGDVSKHVACYVSQFVNDPKQMLHELEHETEKAKTHGAIINTYVDHTIKKLLCIEPITMMIGGEDVPTFNITDYQSVCGYELSRKLDKTVALFTVSGDSVKVGFRSQPHHEPSALALALQLGGGGHKNSAGATIPLHDFHARMDCSPETIATPASTIV